MSWREISLDGIEHNGELERKDHDLLVNVHHGELESIIHDEEP